MEFKEELPIWNAEGVKPPQTKLDEGWQVGDKPPAEWWNWFQNRTYKSLKELREVTEQANIIEDEVNQNKFTIVFRDNIPYFRVEEV